MGNGKVSAPSGFDIIEETTDTTAVQPPEGFEIVDEKKSPDGNGQSTSSETSSSKQEATSPTIDKVKSMVAQRTASQQTPGPSDIQPEPKYAINGKPVKKEEITSQLVTNTSDFVKKLLSGETSLSVQDDPALESMLAGMVKQKKQEDDHYIKNAWQRGWASGAQAEQMMAGNNEQTFSAERIAQLQKTMQANRPRQLYEQAGNAKSLKESLKYFAKDPIGITAEAITESTAAQVRNASIVLQRAMEGGIAGGVAGSVVPGIGTVAGFTTGVSTGLVFGIGQASLNQEYAGKIIEGVQSLGYDATKPEDLEKAFSDEASMAEIKRIALLKGVPVGVFDAFSGGIAGRVFKAPAKKLAGKAVQWGTELIVQGALGAGGELAGQAAAGEEIKAGPAMMEFIGEVGFAPVEIASNKIIDGVRKGTVTVNDFVQAHKVEKKLGKPGDIGKQTEMASTLGEIEEESKQFIDEQLANVAQAETMVPKDVPNRDNAVALIAERIGLEKQKERTDPAFHKPLNDRIKEINDELNPEEVDESEKSADEIIDAARSGDKKAQERLEKYGMDWTKNRVFRFVNKGEVDALLNNERIEGRFKDIGADVTISESPTTAASSEYRVTFKDTDKFDNKKSGSAVKMKNEEDGHLRGGYDINDVEKIERQTEDGGWEVVYKVKDAVPTIGEKTTASESAESEPVSSEGNVSPTSAEVIEFGEGQSVEIFKRPDGTFGSSSRSAGVGGLGSKTGKSAVNDKKIFKTPEEAFEHERQQQLHYWEEIIDIEDKRYESVAEDVKKMRETWRNAKYKPAEVIEVNVGDKVIYGGKEMSVYKFVNNETVLLTDEKGNATEVRINSPNLKKAEEEFPRKNAQVGKFYTYPGQKEPHELIEIINGANGKPRAYKMKGPDGKPFNVTDNVFRDFDEAAPKSEQEVEAEKKGKRHELISEYLAAREAGEFTPPKQQLIADRIHKIREKDFNDFGDPNMKAGGIARQWFSKDALPLDVIAQEMSTEGMEITPQDIIDFVMEYTSGLGGKNSVSEKTFYGKWNLNSKKRDIETDYEKLTGKKLDDNELQQYWNEIEAELGEVEIPEGESLVDQVPEEKRASIGEIIAKYTDENGITDWERMDNDINDFPPNENFTNLAQDAAKQLRQQIKERLSQPKPTTAEGKAGSLPAEKVATSDQRKQELEKELTEVDASLKKAEQDYKSDKAIRQAEADLQRAKDSIKKNIEGKQTDAFKPTQKMLIDDTDEKSAEVTRRQKIVDDLRKDKEREISKLKEKAANLQQQIDQIAPGQIRLDVPESDEGVPLDTQAEPKEEVKQEEAEKKTQRLIRDEKLKKDIDNLWDDFTSAGGKLTSGIDPERLAIGIKIIGKYTQAGIYKLSDILTDASAKLGEKFADYFDAIKAAYNAYYTEAPDDVAEQMDDSKTVRGVNIIDIVPAWKMTKKQFSDAVYAGKIDFTQLGLDKKKIQPTVANYHATTDEQNKAIAKKHIDAAIAQEHGAAVAQAMGDEMPVPKEVVNDFPEFQMKRGDVIDLTGGPVNPKDWQHGQLFTYSTMVGDEKMPANYYFEFQGMDGSKVIAKHVEGFGKEPEEGFGAVVRLNPEKLEFHPLNPVPQKKPLDVKEIRKHWRTMEFDGVLHRPAQEGVDYTFGKDLPPAKKKRAARNYLNKFPNAFSEVDFRHGKYDEFIGNVTFDNDLQSFMLQHAEGKTWIPITEKSWKLFQENSKNIPQPITNELISKAIDKAVEQIGPIAIEGVDTERYVSQWKAAYENALADLTEIEVGKTYRIPEPPGYGGKSGLVKVLQIETDQKGKANTPLGDIVTLQYEDGTSDRSSLQTLKRNLQSEEIKNAPYEPSTTTPLEPDSPRTDATQPMGEEDVQPAGGRSGEGTAQTGKRFEKPADTGQSNSGIPTDTPTSVGIKSHTAVSGQQQLFGFTADTPGVDDSEPSGQPDEPGYDAEQEREDVIDEFADNSFEAKLKAQKKAEGTPHAPGKENIRKSLPLLLPHQIDNVDKAERRFEKHKGFGIFDQTGTGKTLSALGIAKRFLQQGKKNILIVVPSDAKVTDWEVEADFVNIKASGLKDTKDGGRGGVRVTTYHNFYQNSAIDRTWDLVMYDECFTYDTPILTDNGILKIGDIVSKKLSLNVLSLNTSTKLLEWRPIKRWFRNKFKGSLVKIKHSGGELICTPNHKIYVNGNYKQAKDLLHGEELRNMQCSVSDEKPGGRTEEKILQSVLRFKAQGNATVILGGSKKMWGEDFISKKGGSQSGSIYQDERKESDVFARSTIENDCIYEGEENSASRRKREGINGSTGDVSRCVEMENGALCFDEGYSQNQKRRTDTLQNRHSESGNDDSNRSGRIFAQLHESETTGLEENSGLGIVRVESVTLLQRSDIDKLADNPFRDNFIYNIEVEHNHNYFANGILVSNCHNLNANKAGKTTSREEQHKNVTGIAEYVRSAYYKQVDYYGTIKKLTDNQDFDGVGRFEAKVKAEVARRIEERASTKAVFLSATPFAYHKNLFYADGYLFDTKTEFKGGQRGQPSTGGDPQDQFMVNYLGYQWGNKWRNGVQKPESGVDVGLLERELHEKWNKEGAISAYTLKIPQDYSRNFLLVGATEEAKVGREMDRGAEVIWNAKKPDGTRKYEYLPTILRKKWTYVYKNRILEAIKAREILGEVERLANEGKKVVIFHRYNKGVPSHPFRFNPYEEEEIEDEGQTELESLGTRSDASEESYKEFYDNLPKEARMEIAQFEEENPDLYNLNLTGLVNPIETYMSHFGDKAVLFNGDVPKKIRKQNITKFQDPKSGVNVIVVNLAAGEAGLNLHDKLGTAERYTFQLGLPVRPVQATQSEGRTYREGMKSNAHFLYPVLHFNWEKWAFADINDRNVTVENLAMGEQARNMETTLKEGYANPIDDLSESTGTGGKESDSRMEAASPFEKAKTYYWKRAKKTSATKSEEGVDYFATPEPLGFKMVEWMDPRPNDHDAEPSAGHGAIARFFKPFTTNKFIEPSTKLASELAIAATGDVIQSNFEDHHIINKYDGIAMNPPYGQAGATAIAHTKKAIEHLRIGGRIVDLVPQGAFNEKFDKLLAETDIKGRLKYNDIRVVARIKLPSIVFKRAGTGVNTQIIIMDRLAMDATGKPLQEASSVREIDLSHITDINEFFDEIEHLTIPKRPAALPNNTEYQQNQNAAQPKIIAQAGIASQHYFKHTKNGQDCYVVKLEKRVSDSDYSTFRTMAKQLGGYYSSYTTYTQQELADPSKLTRGGAIPGFIFKDKASADQMYQQLTGVVKDVQEQQKNENVDQAVNEMEHIKGKQYLNVEHAFDDLYAKVSAHKQKAEMAAQFVGVRRNYAEIAPDDVDTKGEYSRAPRPLLESLQRIGVATPSEGQVKIYDTVKGVRKEVSSYKVPTWKIEFDKFIGKAIEILDKLKLDTSGKTFALPFPPQLWNGFLSAVQTGLKGGKVIADALADGINWLSTQGVAPHEAQRYADQFKGDVELRRFTKRLMKDSELSQEVKDNISQDAREYAVKKNVLTITEANAIIERLGIDDAIRFVTNIDNDLPYRHRTAMGVILIKKLNAQIKAATDKQQKADLIGKTLEVAEATAKYGTELGQGVQAFATYSKVSAEGILMTYQKEKAKATKNGINTKPFEDDVDFMEELMDMIEMRDQAPEGFLQDEITVDILSKIANRTQTPFGKWYDVAWGIWYASVLSGWETQATNIAGNVINGTFETFNSGLEQAVMQKNPAAVPKLLTALWDGLAEGALTAEHIMRTGKNTNKDSKIQANDILERTRFKGGNLNPYNYYKFVPRFMSAVDGTAYYGLYNMRFHEEMRRKARHEGLKGDALESRVQQLTVTDTAEFERAKEQAEREIEALSTVTGEDYKDYIIKKRAYEIIDQRRRNKHPEAVYEADRFASHGTYNYRPHGFLGVITDAAAGLGRRVPPFRLLVPFTRIVGNLFNQQIDYTPYGFARAFGANASTFFDKHRGEYNPERSTSPMGHEKFNGIKKISDAMGDTQEAEHFRRALFKAAFGTTAMMGLCALTLMRDDDDEKYYFDISGRGPADAAKRNQLYAQGWKPYSIKVGSTYISYKYTPLAIAFYIVGNMRDATKYLELGEKDIFNRTAFALQQIGPALMDMNFLNSLTQFMEKMTQPGSVEQKVKAATTGLASPVKPLVPVIGTNFFKQGSEIFDPTIYSAETIQEGLMKGVPIVQQIGLDAQINALGQPVEKSGNRFWALENSDPVWKLLADKESFIPAIGRSTKMNGTPMNYEQYREFVQRSGQELYKQLNDNLAEYSKMDRVDFDNMLDESAMKIRNRIKHEMELTEVSENLKSKGEAEAINAMITGKYTLKEASDALQKNAITPEVYRGFVKRYRELQK